MNEDKEKYIPINPIKEKNFRNLRNLEFKFLKGKINLILGKNNVGKSNLLDYFNYWYKKNESDDHRIFYLKDGKNFLNYFSKPITFEVKKFLLISTKEDNSLLLFPTCNEHYFFEIESNIFGIKREIILTKCQSHWPLCNLKNLEELSWNARESDFFDSQLLVRELETILKKVIFSLLGNIGWSPDSSGLGDLLLLPSKKNNKGNFSFEFRFSFLDPWDGKRKPIGVGGKKFSFLRLLFSTLEEKEKSFSLSLKGNRNWMLFFSKFTGKKTVLLIDKPEAFLHPSVERQIFFSLKGLAEKKSSNCDVIIVTNSSECLSYFPSEIYDENIGVAILDDFGIVYLKSIIDKIKDPIIKTCAGYGTLFEKDLEKPEEFYRNKWIEILSKEYTPKIFFSKRVFFVEGPTEINFFSYYVLNSLLEHLYKKYTAELDEIDKLIETKKQKIVSDEDRRLVHRLKDHRDAYKFDYVDEVDKKFFWEKFNKIQIIPLFSKFNYIFFAKLSESLLLKHKFLLDDDKKYPIKDKEKEIQKLREEISTIFNNKRLLEEKRKELKKLEKEKDALQDKIKNALKESGKIITWKDFREFNNREKEKKKREELDKILKEWEKNKKWMGKPEQAHIAWNGGWKAPEHKFFYDLTSECKTSKRKNCFCNNIVWIENYFEKFIGIRKTKNSEKNIIKKLPTIFKNLEKGDEKWKSEKWRRLTKPITNESKRNEYYWCKKEEIEKYRSND